MAEEVRQECFCAIYSSSPADSSLLYRLLLAESQVWSDKEGIVFIQSSSDEPLLVEMNLQVQPTSSVIKKIRRVNEELWMKKLTFGSKKLKSFSKCR